MGLFDFFKKKKQKSLYDEMMDIRGMQEQKAIFEQMAKMNQGGCTEDQMPEGIGEFGLVPTNPIPTNTIQGSILYLGGLRAKDGTRVNNERLGSTTVENIKKPIDIYKIIHQNGTQIATIYISPYQAVNSKNAPKGFEQVSPLLLTFPPNLTP